MNNGFKEVVDRRLRIAFAMGKGDVLETLDRIIELYKQNGITAEEAMDRVIDYAGKQERLK